MPPNQINRPEVLAEVRRAFERYENALVSNDVAALNAFFWDSGQVVRYGMAEQDVGIAGIRAYRSSAPPVHPGRTLRETVITAFGPDTASVCTEFMAPDHPLPGRQTQMWVRFDDGWKIVAAHVSRVASPAAGPR